MNKNTRTINPLLYWVETIFIDWWLLRIFAIFYSPAPKKFRGIVRKQAENDLIPFLQGKRTGVTTGEKNYVHAEAFEEALFVAESQAVTSSPLAMIGLIGILAFIINPMLNISSEGIGKYYLVALLAVAVYGIYSYIALRYNVYIMRRIVAGMN